MNCFSIYLTGVGGQGIGLLSEVLLRAGDHAGLRVKGVDTHGLAQRGGIVVSQLRFGEHVHSPLIPEGEADMVIALERNEALRAGSMYLKDKGTLVYYDVEWQPLGVRLGTDHGVKEDDIQAFCKARGIRAFPVFKSDLEDARKQNMILLATVVRHDLIPGITQSHVQMAMEDLMQGVMLESNQAVFGEALAA